MIDVVSTFIFFFAVIDPIGSVPVFIAVTSQFDEATRRKIAFQHVFYAALILVFFVIAGEIILTAMDIPLEAFQVAGGIVLFLFALTMIFGESKPEREVKLAQSGNQTAIFPLAVPSVAGPGAMLAAVLMTENQEYTLLEQAQTTLVILSVLLVVLILALAANAIHRIIGDAGASVISRVMGLIFASVAMNNILQGIDLYFIQ